MLATLLAAFRLRSASRNLIVDNTVSNYAHRAPQLKQLKTNNDYYNGGFPPSLNPYQANTSFLMIEKQQITVVLILFHWTHVKQYVQKTQF